MRPSITSMKKLSVSILSLLLSACANFSAGNLFSHYSSQNSELYQAVKSGQYQEAEEQLPDDVAGPVLDNLEKGRVYLLAGNYEESKSFLEASDQAVREQQDKAVISVGTTATNVGSLAVNDNLTEYIPADYELGFLHLYLGLNYLQKNSLEGALVEVRRANQVQEAARQAREKDLQNAQSEMTSQGISPNLGAVLANYPDAGKVLAAVQNGYLFYLSALLYEASGDLNGAFIDYKRALVVMPDNRAVIDGSLRVAYNLGMRSDYDQLSKRYGKFQDIKAGKGRVIIIDERGIVEAMQSWRQTLPLFDSHGNGALYSIALPYYPAELADSFRPLALNGSPVSGDLLTDVNLMAKRSLSEKMPSIAIRQALRVIAKEQIRREAAKKDDLGNILFNVWNTLTEQPDTRSWITLPGQIFSSSTVVSAGEQTLLVDGKSYHFDLPGQGTVLVWLSIQGNNSTIWHKQLGRL